MTDLLEFLNRIDQKALKQAPPRKDIKAYPGGGSAPYKPMLLLVVLEAIRRGRKPFTQGVVEVASCREGFERLYSAVSGEAPRGGLDAQLAQPFWYLGAGIPRLWTLMPYRGGEAMLERAIAGREQVKTMKRLGQLVSGAELLAADLDLLSDAVANRAIQAFLISTYFTGHEAEIHQVVGLFP